MSLPIYKDYKSVEEWANALTRWLMDNTLDTSAASKLNPPIGAVVEYSATPAPDGWLLCNGASYSTDRYPRLSLVLGSAGPTFTVPNVAGKIIRGL